MTRRAQRGFSLVEMMVVIAIVAVLSGGMISISSSAYGASASAVGDQLTSALDFARRRAISTRRYTHVEVKSRAATVWQSTQTGTVTPTTWQFCQSFTIPDGAAVWHGSTTGYASPGATVSQNPSVSFTIDFRPDGTSTGGTLFVTDPANAHPHRVVGYRGTGTAYARASW